MTTLTKYVPAFIKITKNGLEYCVLVWPFDRDDDWNSPDATVLRLKEGETQQIMDAVVTSTELVPAGRREDLRAGLETAITALAGGHDLIVEGTHGPRLMLKVLPGCGGSDDCVKIHEASPLAKKVLSALGDRQAAPALMMGGGRRAANGFVRLAQSIAATEGVSYKDALRIASARWRSGF